MGMEDFLGHLASKAELHKEIDNLQEGQQAWLFVREETADTESYTIQSVGDVTNQETLWMLECVKRILFDG